MMGPSQNPGSVRQVNENQCQSCMPLGGVITFKGIENAMALVHGSQGCSTYMRLVNVEHYNEPVDIASSSLNEKQTIYGGEANLKKALDNVIRVYAPKVIGVTGSSWTMQRSAARGGSMSSRCPLPVMAGATAKGSGRQRRRSSHTMPGPLRDTRGSTSSSPTSAPQISGR